MPADNRPVVIVVDGSIAMTGALNAAKREADLLSSKARFILVIPAENALPDKDFAEFERIVRMPIPHLRKSLKSMVSYLPSLIASTRRLHRLLRETECDRLQINDFYLMQGPFVRLLGYRGAIVTWVRIDPTRFSLAGRAWLAAIRKTSTHVVAVSAFIRDRLRARLESRIIYDPVARAVRSGQPDSPPRYVFVGNFIEGKGQNIAIAAFQKVADAHGTAELHFFGGDMGLSKNQTWKASLRDQARAGPGADRIKFNDFTPSAAAFEGAFAALNLSESESFSLVCQEASATGLAVIATRSGGPEEIIRDGETGFLVPIGSVEEVAKAMDRLLTDPAMAQRMGQAGQRLMQHRFPADQFKRSVEEILRLA